MKRRKLGEILQKAGVITPQQLAEALEDQKRYGGKLGTILLERRMISEKQYFQALTSQLRIPAVDFTKSTVPEEVIKYITQELAEKHTVFPVAVKRTPQGNVLVLAMADPTNVEVQDEIRFTTGCKVEPALALESTLQYVIRDYYFHQEGRGSYQLERDFGLGGEDSGQETFYHIEQARVSEPDEPELLTSTEGKEPEVEELSGDKPKLSRELKALLKLLAQKGIITPKEYREAFKETK